MEINQEYELADIIAEEHSELIWDMIKDVQSNKEGSLLKLAGQLTKETPWTEKITYE